MIPKECKRLAEVDFPLASVSKAALAESASHGNHPKVFTFGGRVDRFQLVALFCLLLYCQIH
jgi:hypothetical protein